MSAAGIKSAATAIMNSDLTHVDAPPGTIPSIAARACADSNDEPLDLSVMSPAHALSGRISFDLGQGFPTGFGSPFEGPHDPKSPSGEQYLVQR